ncbi:MAG: P-II family nitrogen regulator [Candidatus Omnitrophica bacterium]|nr:P-II family nitrogen regulator [Candidatus Omnitrophota bacterium]
MFKLIMAILPKGRMKAIMPHMKNAGIFGATMLSGKGMCTTEGRRALGRRIGSSREILILLTLDSNRDKLVKLLEKYGNLKDPGQGIVFVTDISQVIG